MKPTLIIQLILAILITFIRLLLLYHLFVDYWIDYGFYYTAIDLLSLIFGLILVYSGLFTRVKTGQWIYVIIGFVFLLINSVSGLEYLLNTLDWGLVFDSFIVILSNLAIVATFVLILLVTVTQSRSLLFITKILSWLTLLIGIVYFLYRTYFIISYGYFMDGFGLILINNYILPVIVIPVSLISFQVISPQLENEFQDQVSHSMNGFKYCQQCGNSTSMDSIVCENCNAIFPKMKSLGTSSSDSILWGILGFCIPLVGLILFFTWNQTQPKNAKYSGIGALIGTIFGFISLLLISFIIFLELIY